MEDLEPTLGQALEIYFAYNHFGSDGGYASNWVTFKLGPLLIPFPNTDARKRAVRFHDLHHLVTGYETDFLGEFEISAWEIGSGCRNFVAAWHLNLAGMAGGLFFCPSRTFRAFRRGRSSANYYGSSYDDALLDTPVAEARRALYVDRELRRSFVADAALFAVAEACGIVIGGATLFVSLPLALAALPFLRMASRKALSADCETRSG